MTVTQAILVVMGAVVVYWALRTLVGRRGR
jgi:hypothetical protein